MAEGDFDKLQHRLLSDDELLDRFRQSPREVLEEHEITLTEEEHTKVSQTVSGTDTTHELRARIQSQGFKTTML
jgi:hypothetical protein